MADGKLRTADYKEIKARNEPQIAKLEREKKNNAQLDANLLKYVTQTTELLHKLFKYYQPATLILK